MRKHDLLGIRVCATDYAEASETICAAAAARRALTVTALAVHGVMTGVLDRMHRQRLNTLDMVLPDGQPVRWGLNLLFGTSLRDRVCGPKLMLEVSRRCAEHGLRVALYGSKPAVLDELRDNLCALYPGLQIVATIPSRFGRVSREQQRSLAAEIAATGADLVFIGLGCPRQEVWLFENREFLQMPAIAVGAAFDFHAKRIPQAPVWMQESGLEWAFRLRQEPWRLWRRYVLLNPLYLFMLGLQKLRLWRRPFQDDPKSVCYEGFA